MLKASPAVRATYLAAGSTGKVSLCSATNWRAFSGSLSVFRLSTMASARPFRLSCSFWTNGSSFRQGTHQVAHTLTKATFPSIARPFQR